MVLLLTVSLSNRPSFATMLTLMVWLSMYAPGVFIHCKYFVYIFSRIGHIGFISYAGAYVGHPLLVKDPRCLKGFVYGDYYVGLFLYSHPYRLMLSYKGHSMIQTLSWPILSYCKIIENDLINIDFS